MRKLLLTVALLASFAVSAKPEALASSMLKPTDAQAQAATWASRFLTRFHYNPMPLDDAMSQKIFDSYFQALEMIKAEPGKAFAIMGADVKQSAEQFEASQKYLRWQDRAANQKFFAGEHAAFSKEAAEVLLEAGIIRQLPDMSKLADPRFIQ